MRTPRDPIYAGHRYPAEIISYAVWLYFRFPLSLRMVGLYDHTSPPARVPAHAREGTSSASIWTGTRVPRNTGFPPMILLINRSLVGARVERISSARAPEMCPF